ncbi:hypothetical protein [Inquilinus limosus]|uniref:hypothetical protein n=1 Tax=Inquilinus limosus TaxID=171674 RepID=UPI0012DCD00E|nr:hypothetical protein [Inquilinus limosus]
MKLPRIFGSLKLEDVFTPGGQPSVTYVNRAHLGIESKLKKAISLPNTIVSLTGPTKSGKTVLCKSVLEKFDYVWIDRGQIKNEEDIWERICTELRLASEVVQKDLFSGQSGASLTGGISAGIPGNQINATLTASGSKLRTREESRRYIPNNSHQATEYLVKHKICLVVDDFHYIPEESRSSFIRSLKGSVFRGLKTILLSTPHRAFEAIKAEPEITGRFKHVLVPQWSIEDLTLIANSGFEALNVSVLESIISTLSKESEGSPLLMQRFCWNICYDEGINETCILRKNLQEKIDTSSLFNEVAEDAGLPIYEKLAKGPQSRTERIQRPLANGGSADIYEAILLAVAVTGPKERLTYDQIRSSLNAILLDKIPQKLEVSNALNHLTNIDKDENKGQRAIDWDPENLDLFLTDPFFRFYLRWKIANQRNIAS